MKALTLFKSTVEDVNTLQRNLKDFVQHLLKCPILDGVLIDPITITSAQFNVPHGLGRAFRGYIIVRCYGTTFSLAEAVPQPDPTKYVRLASTTDSSGALYIF